MLRAWLAYHRATLLMKAGGLAEDAWRRPMVPSGTSMGGLVKHLGYVERWWFRIVFRAEELDVPWTGDDPDADWRVEPGETPEQIVGFYMTEIEASDRAVAGASLDDVAEYPDSEKTLRWIMTHMIEETARHNGHADILREMLDGATGK